MLPPEFTVRSDLPIEYRPDIDGLRAVAVLSVIGYHASPRLVPGGFVGVDIFFVISGYLISSIIFNGLTKGRFTFAEFYVRRIRRIFPALIVVLAFCWIFGWFVLFTDEYKVLGKHMAGSAIFISNILLWQESGYFDLAAGSKPLLHLWSLAVEEQYYLIWPLLLVVAWRRALDLVVLIALIWFVSFALNVASVRIDAALAFYWPHARLWELLSGGLLAYVSTKRSLAAQGHPRLRPYLDLITKERGPLFSNTAAILGATLVAVSVLTIENETTFPGWWALLPVLGTFLLILIGRRAWLVHRVLSNPLLVFVGLISYPLYLWHWPLLWFANTIEVGYASVTLRIVTIGIAFFLAWITYEFIETPIRASARGGRPTAVPVLLSILLASLGLLGYWTFENDEFGRNGESLFIKDVSASEYQATRGGFFACDSAFLGSRKFGLCLRSKQDPPEMAVFGDSHADHLFPGIAKLDARNSWVLLGEGSCPPALGIRSYRTGRNDKCAEASEEILALLKANAGIKTVVLASLGPYYFSGVGFAPEHLVPGEFDARSWNLEPTGISDSKATKEQVFLNGLDRAIEALESARKDVVLYIDVPELNFSPRECVERPLRSIRRMHCVIDRKMVQERQREYRSVIATLERKHPHLRVFDPLKYLCDEKQCVASSKNVIYYRDGHHLSIRGSEYLAKPFLNWLGSLR